MRTLAVCGMGRAGADVADDSGEDLARIGGEANLRLLAEMNLGRSFS